MKKGFNFGILISVFLFTAILFSFVDIIRVKSKTSEEEVIFAIPLADVITLDENKITPEINATSLDCEYDGLPHYISATISNGLQDRLVITYRNDVGEIITDPIIPGTYVVDISFAGDETYNGVTKSVGLTIKKAEFKNVSLPDLTIDYDGQAHNLTVTGAPEGTIAVFDKVDLVDAGKYPISVRISKLYYNDQILTGNLTINKITPIITGSNAEAVYDGLAHYVTANISDSLTLKRTYRNSSGVTVSNPVNADTYTVTLSFAGSTNYNSVSQIVTLKINPALMTGITLPNEAFVYDGNIHNLTAMGIPEGGTVVYDSQGYINAGTYPIRVTVSKPNYVDYSTTGTLTIRRASLQGLVTFNDKTYEYDGAWHSIEVEGLPLIGTKVVYNMKSQINAGTYNVMAVIEGDNYEPLTLYAWLIIKKAQAVIFAQDFQEFIYDESPKDIACDLNHNETSLLFDPGSQLTDIGTYTVTITAPETANYFGTVKTITVIIRSPEILGVVFNDMTVVYDGLEHVLTAQNIPEKATVAYAGNIGMNAGMYQATVTVTLYVEQVTLTATLTITKAEAVITADDVQSFVYDGAFKRVLASLNHSETDLIYSALGFTNAGTYEITIDAPETVNYFPTNMTVTFKIDKAVAIIDAESLQVHLYDGVAHEIVASLNHNEIALSYAPQRGYVNAGTYEITVSAQETDNYLSAEIIITLQINKAQAFIQADPVQTYVYDGRLKRVYATLNHFESYLSYFPAKGYTNAGTYHILIVADESTNYLSAQIDVLLVIKKAKLTGITFDDLTVSYDGYEHEILADNIPNDAMVTYFNNQASDAGVFEAEVLITRLNYEDLRLQATLVITKVESVIETQAVQQFEYDGMPHDVVASLNYIGTPLSLTPASSFTEIGEYDVTVSVDENGNHTGKTVSVKVIIIMGTPVITAPVQSVVYNGQSQFLNVSISNGLSMTITYRNPDGEIVEEPVKVGTYSVLMVYTGSEHYHPVVKTSAFTIQPALLTGITMEPEEYVYDGFTHALVASGVPGDAQIEYLDNLVSEAGVHEVVAIITRANYETLKLTSKLTIHPRPLTLDGLQAESRPYDGSLRVMLSGGDLAGIIRDDDVSFVPGYGMLENPHAGTGKKVTLDITLIGEDSANYTVVMPEITAEITRFKAPLKTNPLVKPEDGTTLIEIGYIHLGATVYPDDVYLIGSPVGTFASVNPGENIPLAISGISLAGEDASDYEIDDMGLTGTILRTSMSVESDEFGMITIISPNGFDPDLKVMVQAARDAITFNDLSRRILNADSSQTVRAIFNVLFLKNGQAVSFNQPFTMTVTIPETYRHLKQMRLYHVSATGDIMSDDWRDGNQMSIDGESINFYVFTSSPVNLMSFLIIALVSILMIVVVVILHVRRYQLSLHYKRS